VNCKREGRVEATAAHAPGAAIGTAALAGGDEWQGTPKLLPFHYYMLRRLRAAGETVGRLRGGSVWRDLLQQLTRNLFYRATYGQQCGSKRA
jgi:hypothetical protein